MAQKEQGAVNEYGEPVDLLDSIRWTTSRLWTAGTGFFFIAWFFAYIYLKTINANAMWRPAGIKPPSIVFGIIVLVAAVASAIVHQAGLGKLKGGDAAGWRPSALGALLLAVVAIVVQIVELTNTGFGWGSAAYASVFVGWSLFIVVFWIGGAYHLETLVARQSVALKGRPNGEVAADLEWSARSFQFYWWMMAGVEVLAFILLYLVK